MSITKPVEELTNILFENADKIPDGVYKLLMEKSSVIYNKINDYNVDKYNRMKCEIEWHNAHIKRQKEEIKKLNDTNLRLMKLISEQNLLFSKV